MERLILDLPIDVSITLRKAVHEKDVSHEQTAVALLRDALIELGHLNPIDELDEDGEAAGNV